MTTASALYKSKSNFLNASDLKNQEANLKIAGVSTIEMDGQHKLQVRFEGREKTLVLNQTNAHELIRGYGDTYEEWVGKGIILFPSSTGFEGREVACIRVRLEQPQ